MPGPCAVLKSNTCLSFLLSIYNHLSYICIISLLIISVDSSKAIQSARILGTPLCLTCCFGILPTTNPSYYPQDFLQLRFPLDLSLLALTIDKSDVNKGVGSRPSSKSVGPLQTKTTQLLAKQWNLDSPYSLPSYWAVARMPSLPVLVDRHAFRLLPCKRKSPRSLTSPARMNVPLKASPICHPVCTLV